MRYALLIALMFALAACDAPPAPLPADGPRIEMLVHGIDCAGCAREVEAALTQLPGVAAVSVDRRDGRVTVVVSETNPPTRQQLIDAVQRSGKYRVISVTEP